MGACSVVMRDLLQNGWAGQPVPKRGALGLRRVTPEKPGAAEGRHMALLTTGRLPAQLVPLVGRQRELQDVVDALSRSRLLTLTGPGGTGKTRLALAAAEAVRASYVHGVC